MNLSVKSKVTIFLAVIVPMSVEIINLGILFTSLYSAISLLFITIYSSVDVGYP